MYHIVSLPCCRLLDARSSWICRVTKSSFFGRWVELVFVILYELLVQRHIWFSFSFYFFRHSFHNDLVNLLAYKIRNVVIFYYCLQFLLQWVWLLLSPWLPLLLLCSLFWTNVTFAKKLFFLFDICDVVVSWINMPIYVDEDLWFPKFRQCINLIYRSKWLMSYGTIILLVLVKKT